MQNQQRLEKYARDLPKLGNKWRDSVSQSHRLQLKGMYFLCF